MLLVRRDQSSGIAGALSYLFAAAVVVFLAMLVVYLLTSLLTAHPKSLPYSVRLGFLLLFSAWPLRYLWREYQSRRFEELVLDRGSLFIRRAGSTLEWPLDQLRALEFVGEGLHLAGPQGDRLILKGELTPEARDQLIYLGSEGMADRIHRRLRQGERLEFSQPPAFLLGKDSRNAIVFLLIVGAALFAAGVTWLIGLLVVALSWYVVAARRVQKARWGVVLTDSGLRAPRHKEELSWDEICGLEFDGVKLTVDTRRGTLFLAKVPELLAITKLINRRWRESAPRVAPDESLEPL